MKNIGVVYTFENVVETLSEISREFAELIEDIGDIDYELEQAKHEEKMAFARTFMSLNGSMELRKQQSILDAERESLDVVIATAKMRAAKSRMDYLRMAFDAARSINAAKRSEFLSEPTGQWT